VFSQIREKIPVIFIKTLGGVGVAGTEPCNNLIDEPVGLFNLLLVAA